MNDEFDDKIYDRDEYLKNCEADFAFEPARLPQDFIFSSYTLSQSFRSYEMLVDLCKYDENKTALTLSQCLPKLPNLTTVAIARSIDQPGLNADSCAYANFKNENWSAGERIAFDLIQVTESGVDKLIQELANTDVAIAELEVGNGLSDRLEHWMSHPELDIPADCFVAIAKNLTHLTISIKNDDFSIDEGVPGTYIWMDFLTAATNLTHLRIYTECSSQEAGNIVPMILNNNTFRKLEAFELIGDLDHPASIRAVSLVGFLNRRVTTLRHLQLDCVLLMNWYALDDTRFIMYYSLEYLKQTSMLLHRRDEHGASARGPHAACRECDGICKEYCMLGGPHSIPVEDLD